MSFNFIQPASQASRLVEGQNARFPREAATRNYPPWRQDSHSCHVCNVACGNFYQCTLQMPYYGQKLAIKFKFYGKVVRMAKKCYLFLNVLFNPQILSHQKVKLVGESLRKYLIAALGGDPKVHSGPDPRVRPVAPRIPGELQTGLGLRG